MPADTPWLHPDDLETWRAWLRLTTDLPAALHRRLHDECGLSLQDYDVLVQLSEAPRRRLRATALADAVHWERSRLSHHVQRMEARGLVRRESCAADGRGSFVVLTAAGAQALRRAAPGHARAVQELLFAALGDRDRRALARVVDKVLRGLDANGS